MNFRLPHEDSPLDAPPLPNSAAILVVDEDPAFQLGLKTFLREYVGFEKVFTARSGQEALDFIRAEPMIEVVTLDYRMPGMSGIEVLRALRGQVSRPLAVLMITGHADDELEAEFHAQGTDTLLTTHFLTKPVQFEKLEPVVLAAHEEVLAAKRRELISTPAMTIDEVISSDDLAGKLDAQANRIAELENELRAQRRKWRADFWKLAFVLLLFWLAGQFGLIEKVEPHWARVKDKVMTTLESWTRRDSKEATAPATGENVTPAPSAGVGPL